MLHFLTLSLTHFQLGKQEGISPQMTSEGHRNSTGRCDQTFIALCLVLLLCLHVYLCNQSMKDFDEDTDGLNWVTNKRVRDCLRNGEFD